MSDWHPNNLEEIEKKWWDVRVPVKETLSHSQAEKLMLTYLAIREDWLQAYVQATLYKEMADFKYNTSFHLAYLRAEGKTDKAREIEAKTQPPVQTAIIAKAEAEAAVLKAKLKLESATLAHHAAAKVYQQSAQELWSK